MCGKQGVLTSCNLCRTVSNTLGHSDLPIGKQSSLHLRSGWTNMSIDPSRAASSSICSLDNILVEILKLAQKIEIGLKVRLAR